jgi:hypothetical protein
MKLDCLRIDLEAFKAMEHLDGKYLLRTCIWLSTDWMPESCGNGRN